MIYLFTYFYFIFIIIWYLLVSFVIIDVVLYWGFFVCLFVFVP